MIRKKSVIMLKAENRFTAIFFISKDRSIQKELLLAQTIIEKDRRQCLIEINAYYS